MKIAFMTDPDRGNMEDSDLAASWGALTLWARGSNLTAHSYGGMTLESVSWYLLPFLEWVVENWDPLIHEERLPGAVRGDDAAHSLAKTSFPPPSLTPEEARRWETHWELFWRRHALQACRDGGPFPDVMLRRWRDLIEVSWRNRASAGLPADWSFLAAGGCERLDVATVAKPLYDVVREAALFLRERRPDSARIGSLVDRTEHLRATDVAT